jgi:hypothetical protein
VLPGEGERIMSRHDYIYQGVIVDTVDHKRGSLWGHARDDDEEIHPKDLIDTAIRKFTEDPQLIAKGWDKDKIKVTWFVWTEDPIHEIEED